MSLGLLLILAALGLAGYNLWSEKKAGEHAENVVTQMEASEESQDDKDGQLGDKDAKDAEPEFKIYPDIPMPTVLIDGHYYIGTLEIPAYGLKLPVMEEWSYPKLRVAPCRYVSSVYRDDMIIAAHNYSRHFGQIGNLIVGDEVIFTDVDKNRFVYQVIGTEILEKMDGEKMESGEWYLTLCTCTYGGLTRVTVSCKRMI